MLFLRAALRFLPVALALGAVSPPVLALGATRRPSSIRPIAGSGPRQAPSSTFVPRPVPPDLPGEQCLADLRARGVAFQVVDSLRGVATPIRVSGKLGGVEFWANDHRPLLLDCRLALALAKSEPTFRAFGVKRVRFSGAYDYRTTVGGRLSHHAHGLAIDIHDVETAGGRLDVRRDFKRRLGCEGDGPQLNQISCHLKSSGIFDEFLTPDTNAAHWDHLHVSVHRLTNQRELAAQTILERQRAEEARRVAAQAAAAAPPGAAPRVAAAAPGVAPSAPEVAPSASEVAPSAPEAEPQVGLDVESSEGLAPNAEPPPVPAPAEGSVQAASESPPAEAEANQAESPAETAKASDEADEPGSEDVPPPPPPPPANASDEPAAPAEPPLDDQAAPAEGSEG